MDEKRYLMCSEEAMAHLCRVDSRMRAVIERLGPIRREVLPTLFAALVHAIVGQQISTKAHAAIWGRMCAAMGEVTPQRVLALGIDELRSYGISLRKATYIARAAERVASGEMDLEALYAMSDEEVCRRLTTLDGIGEWSAQMLMIFAMQRPDVLSYKDMGIQRGLRMVYHHRHIDRQRYEKYRRRYSPYGSVASLYLWEVAGGAIPGMRDYAPRTQGAKKGATRK